MKNNRLDKQTILITGASGGIGSAIAMALSAEGASLVLVGRTLSKLKKLDSQLTGEHLIIECDITTSAGRTTLVHECEQLLDGLDIVINNAGISNFALLENTQPDVVNDIINTNLSSQILLCQSMLPLLKARPKAKIINIGSSFGSIGYPGFACYCASKFGLRGFSEALARELMDTSVSVNYFAPRATLTAINDQKVVEMNQVLSNKMDSPEIVAKAFIQFLYKDQRRLSLGWPEKLFVVVNSLFPSIVDSAIGKKLAVIKRYL